MSTILPSSQVHSIARRDIAHVRELEPSEALVDSRLRDLIVDIAERIGIEKIIAPQSTG